MSKAKEKFQKFLRSLKISEMEEPRMEETKMEEPSNLFKQSLGIGLKIQCCINYEA